MEHSLKYTALLVMDMQSSILRNLPESAGLTGNVARAIFKARESGMQVIYVVVGFRKGGPEISMNNKGFSLNKERFTKADPDEFVRIHPDVAPVGSEITVVKRRVSAFTGSDLEVILRALGIEHIVLTGVATGGVVLSTLREAADKDFRITVLSDACADADDEVHRVLTTKIFVRQAEVLTVEQWCNI